MSKSTRAGTWRGGRDSIALPMRHILSPARVEKVLRTAVSLLSVQQLEDKADGRGRRSTSQCHIGDAAIPYSHRGDMVVVPVQDPNEII